MPVTKPMTFTRLLTRVRRNLLGYLILWVMGIYAFWIPVVTIEIFSIIRDNSQDLFVKNSHTVIESFAGLLDESVVLNEQSRLVDMLDGIIFVGDLIYAEVIVDGVTIRPNLVEETFPYSFHEDEYFGQGDDHIYFVSSPLYSTQSNKKIEIRFGFNELVVDQFISQAYQRALLLFSVFTIATVILLTYVARRITVPIKQVQKIARSITSGDTAEHIKIDSSFDEIDGLANDLEKMRRELVNQTRVLRKLSYRDELTRLPNRLVLNNRLEQAVLAGHRTKIPFALLILDLNKFKEVNDALGHQAGDLLLQEIALRMLGAVRVSDTVARLAGDEFAVLLHSNTEETAAELCKKLAGLIKSPYTIEDQTVYVGVSIGVSCYPQHGQDAEDLMRRADIAMYHAKKNGIDFSIFAEQQNEDALYQMHLRTDFQKAMPRKELRVYYQPKIDFRNGKITGFEALVRWLHPLDGIIAPDLFIPIAEQSGLINDLTFYVLRQAAMDTIVWRDAGYDINIAVNIAPKNLTRADFGEEVLKILDDTGLAPSYVELELTENDILDEPILAIRILEQLDKENVKIVVDDFGTGYSSLTYLKKLPISALKIDRSFVIDMIDDDDNAEIVKASIEMAHNIGLMVVAEGVESKEAIEFLKENDCDWGQGYFFSKPIPADEVLDLLSSFKEQI